MAQAPLRIARRGEHFPLHIIRPDHYKQTITAVCNGLHPRLGNESPLQLVGADVARWIVNLLPREASYLMVTEYEVMGDNCFAYAWISDRTILIREYQLDRFSEWEDGHQEDGYLHWTGHDMWLACTAPTQPHPSKLTHLAYLHHSRKVTLDLYQLPFDATTTGVWINNPDPDQDLVVSSRPLDPEWVKVEHYEEWEEWEEPTVPPIAPLP